MNWTKYMVALLIFTAAVAVGSSVALSRFNHRVCPWAPVRAFELKGEEPGVYQVIFLGESIRLALPVDTALELYRHKYVQASREYLAEKIVTVKRNSLDLLEDPPVRLNDIVLKMKIFIEDWLNQAEAWQEGKIDTHLRR